LASANGPWPLAETVEMDKGVPESALDSVLNVPPKISFFCSGRTRPELPDLNPKAYGPMASPRRNAENAGRNLV